jgi:hypothetical protein
MSAVGETIFWFGVAFDPTDDLANMGLLDTYEAKTVGDTRQWQSSTGHLIEKIAIPVRVYGIGAVIYIASRFDAHPVRFGTLSSTIGAQVNPTFTAEIERELSAAGIVGEYRVWMQTR